MTRRDRFSEYRAALERDLQSGLATEHTYRPALERLIESLDGAQATNEPRRAKYGAPDYTVWRREPHGPMTIGYIEAKDVGTPLDPAERSEQLERYLPALNNLILTDYVEFRWYVDGVWRRTERLGTIDPRGRLVAAKGAELAVDGLLRDFLAQSPPTIRKPDELADRMARLTRLVRDLIVASFEQNAATGIVRDLRKAFEEVLVPHLSVAEFADMFAQTIAYGLFAARANHSGPSEFRRHDAAYEIPRTNPFLRGLFAAITGPELDEEPYAGLVDDLAQLLAATDIDSVLSDFGTKRTKEDPVVHFYETFLAAYDPAVREMRGVYYTPAPVVSYIVRSVDQVLRRTFRCSEGLAEVAGRDGVDAGLAEAPPRVLILDPACGTGTFLYAVIDQIRQQFRQQQDAGKWSAYVREQLIPRLFGFELLMAPYAVAHLKLGLQLAAQDLPDAERRDWAYDAEGNNERLGVYLTNTLEEALKRSEVLLGSYIAEEANAAAAVKRELPILVVLGNPPYSGHSANKGKWIRDLVADYARPRPGIPKPAQGKWLQDDYIKFIRFAQWRIERTGSGVLAFITNHSYLDSPTFAGMRLNLIETFSDIYVLDLHGNTKKRERAPGGGVDQNVFDIQQGVAISLFVKQPGKAGPAIVRHASLYGKRQDKYDWLSEHNIDGTDWSEVQPDAPLFLFVPQNTDLLDEYERGWSIAEMMSETGAPAPGFITTHDQFAISWTATEARAKVRRLLQTKTEDEARSLWRLCSQSQWSYEKAKKELAPGDWEELVEPVLYRPFDTRWTVFDSNVAVHQRKRVTDHLRSGPNIALVTSRMTKGEDFAHAQVTRRPSEAICMSPKTSNNGFVFPLYLYPSSSGRQRRLLIEGEHVGRRPNLSPKIIAQLEQLLELRFVADGAGDLLETFGPEDVFHYVYAVLHAPSYRSRYVDFLRHDFPRIPLIHDPLLFANLVSKGRDLVELHLFEGAPSDAPNVSFPVPGTNIVAGGHPRYMAPGDLDPVTKDPVDQGRVYISPDVRKAGVRGQYFRGIPPAVWSSKVGGYHVCEKWLKDRRGRALALAEINHYARLVSTIDATLALMDEIDELTQHWPLDAVANAAASGDSERFVRDLLPPVVKDSGLGALARPPA